MLDLYAALGIPEIRQYDAAALGVSVLGDGGTCERAAASPGWPLLPFGKLPRWLERDETAGESVMTLEFLDWVHGTLVPRAPGA